MTSAMSTDFDTEFAVARWMKLVNGDFKADFLGFKVESQEAIDAEKRLLALEKG